MRVAAELRHETPAPPGGWTEHQATRHDEDVDLKQPVAETVGHPPVTRDAAPSIHHSMRTNGEPKHLHPLPLTAATAATLPRTGAQPVPIRATFLRASAWDGRPGRA